MTQLAAQTVLVTGANRGLGREFVRQLLDTPEYRSLHAATMLNGVASEIAAAAFAEQFADLKAKEEEATGGEVFDAAGGVVRVAAVRAHIGVQHRDGEAA